MKVLALEPFFGGSHRQFWEGLRAHSVHEVEILGMPPRHWKWRMRGAAFWMAQEMASRDTLPDLVLASDFVNLADLVAILPDRWRRIPRAIYFHENQLTYPVSPGEKLDYHFGLINVASALAARRLFFNSEYHRREFFDELPRFLKRLPDFRPTGVVPELERRAIVLPLGCDLAFLDRARSEAAEAADSAGRETRGAGEHAPAHSPDCAPLPRGRDGGAGRLVLWNHRWEFDKDPEAFFGALDEIKRRGVGFRLLVAGERAIRWPAVFDRARERFAGELVHIGTLGTRSEYAGALHRADLVVSTAIHEFFGVAVAEAVFCGAYPLLPDALAYPELIPPTLWERHLYEDRGSLVRRLRDALEDPVLETDPALAAHIARFDWSVLGPRYDEALSEAAVARDGGIAGL
jgi:glycosyltransferase involved in cell wall biosynthesis